MKTPFPKTTLLCAGALASALLTAGAQTELRFNREFTLTPAPAENEAGGAA